jgi:hypothetical protein
MPDAGSPRMQGPEELWGKMVTAIRHSTGTAYAGFLQKLELDITGRYVL